MAIAVERLRAGTFVLAGVCFLLPFVTASCPAGRFTFTGIQLAMGQTIQEPQMFGPAKPRHISPEPLASAALGLVVLGILTSLARGRFGRLSAAWTGGIAGLLLLLLKTKLDNDAQRQAGLFVLNYEVGYWVAIITCLAAAAQGWLLREMKASTPNAARPTSQVERSPEIAFPSTVSGFCEECGAALRTDDKYCPKCGVATPSVSA